MFLANGSLGARKPYSPFEFATTEGFACTVAFDDDEGVEFLTLIRRETMSAATAGATSSDDSPLFRDTGINNCGG